MNTDSLKVTSYFGERQRTGGGFAADALLDLYGRHQIATSILLRGAEGFGARHRLRTDRSLTPSEDLPLISVAVDSRARVEEVLEPTARLIGAGLVTLERARLLSGDIEAVALRDEVHEETKLTIYLGRQERVYRVPAFVRLRSTAPPRHRRRHRAARRRRHRARPPGAGDFLQQKRGDTDDGHRGGLRRAHQQGAARTWRAAIMRRMATGCSRSAGTCPPSPS